MIIYHQRLFILVILFGFVFAGLESTIISSDLRQSTLVDRIQYCRYYEYHKFSPLSAGYYKKTCYRYYNNRNTKYIILEFSS